MSTITSEDHVKFMEGPNRLFIDVVHDFICPVIDKIHSLKQKSVDSICRIVGSLYNKYLSRVKLSRISLSEIDREDDWIDLAAADAKQTLEYLLKNLIAKC